MSPTRNFLLTHTTRAPAHVMPTDALNFDKECSICSFLNLSLNSLKWGSWNLTSVMFGNKLSTLDQKPKGRRLTLSQSNITLHPCLDIVYFLCFCQLHQIDKICIRFHRPWKQSLYNLTLFLPLITCSTFSFIVSIRKHGSIAGTLVSALHVEMNWENVPSLAESSHVIRCVLSSWNKWIIPCLSGRDEAIYLRWHFLQWVCLKDLDKR